MSGIATGTALAIGLGASAAGGIATAGIGALSSTSAADTQASAAEQGQELQAQEAQNALNFQQQEWNTQQSNLAPWLKSGEGALSNLTGLLSTPGKGLLTPWSQTFTPPTEAQAEQYPGYKFQLGQGEEALQNSAAANGSLESGNTQEALNNYAQNYAQNDYTNVYNQAQQQYQQNYGIFENNQTNTYNRLAALAGTGQTAATTLGTEGQQAATNTGNIDLTTGMEQAQEMNNAAAATASGYVGAGNAISSGLTGATSNMTQLALLSQLLNNPGATGPGSGNYAAGISFGS